MCSFGDEIVFTQGSVEDLRFAAAFGKNGRIVGAITFNHGKWLEYYGAMIERSAPFPPPPPGYDQPANAQPMSARFPDRANDRDSRCRSHRPRPDVSRCRVPPQSPLERTTMTSAETAWTEAMKYENRHDPYRFFDELRKTPVVQVADKVYVVTGYRELLQLAHDPHVSSDISKSPISAQPAADAQPDVGAEHMQAYGREPSLIVSDPAKHDKQRRQVMRHFAPPHSPNDIPNMAADIQTLCNDSLDKIKANGGNVFDVVDDYAYPVPVAVICQILGVPLKDEPTFHGWIFDFMAGADMGPDAATEEGQARKQKGKESTAALTAYMADLIQGFLTEPKDNVLSKLVNDKDGPDGPMTPAGGRGQCDAAVDRRPRLDGQHHRALCADAVAQSRVDRASAREARTDPQGDRRGSTTAVGRAVLPQPQRYRRRRGRWHGHPGGLGGAPALRRR